MRKVLLCILDGWGLGKKNKYLYGTNDHTHFNSNSMELIADQILKKDLNCK